MTRIARHTAVTLTLALAVSLVVAVPAQAGIKVLKPKKEACIQEGLKVGVKWDGEGSSRFKIKIKNKANGKVVFTRKGTAKPTMKTWVYNVPFSMPFVKKYVVRYRNPSTGLKTFRVTRYGCE